MKRFLIALLTLLLVPSCVFAGEVNKEEQYKEYLSCFDFSFMNELSNDTRQFLDELEISDFDYASLSSFDISRVGEILSKILNERIKSPVKSCSLVLLIVLLSALLKSLRVEEGSSLENIYSTISSIAIGIVLLAEIGSTIKLATASLSVASNFIFAFVPTFCAIIAVGGGTATSLSTNTSLLMLSQGLSFISSNLFMPVINSFLAVSVCSGLRAELNLGSLLATLKRVITSAISFLSAMFVSILSIKTTISARSDILGIRSVRFLINTVVPVIGGSISEGLLSIQGYSSLIRSSVGIVGIIAVSLVFLPAIIDVVVWRMALSVCSIASDMFCDNSVSMLINAFRETLLLINVVLILSLVTTIISIGILIASRTG